VLVQLRENTATILDRGEKRRDGKTIWKKRDLTKRRRKAIGGGDQGHPIGVKNPYNGVT